MMSDDYWPSICGIEIRSNECITEEQAIAYALHGKELYGDKVTSMSLVFDGDEVEIDYYGKQKLPKFERIRRITGYLVGTLDRFNDAKLAEVNDRVKHEM